MDKHFVTGKDYIGNTYFEIPANPSEGKRKPSRWYDPPKGQDFQNPIPAEWESWLRMRRYFMKFIFMPLIKFA